MSKEKKLEKIPAKGLAKQDSLAAITAVIPAAKVKKLNLPPLVKFGEKEGQIQIGTTVSGALVGMIDNFTGKTDMRGSRTLHLKHESGLEFLLPFTGTIKSTFRQLMNADQTEFKPGVIGSTFFFTRQPDGFSDKFKKAQFNVDVVMAEK